MGSSIISGQGRETCPVVSEASSSAFSALHTKLCISPPKSMAYYYSRLDFFCHLCGTTLIVPSSEYAQCSLCKTLQDIQDIRDKEISYTITAKEIRRELGMEIIEEQKVQLSKMRSADEGQTTFYTCTRCGHQSQEN